MYEEPIDRSRDAWMDRKRRLEHDDALRRDDMDPRYRISQDGTTRHTHSPPPGARSDSRLTLPNMSTGSRNSSNSPRTNLPPINSLTSSSSSEDQIMRDEADAAIKRRRLADGLDPLQDRRREGDLTPPGGMLPSSSSRSPLHRRSELPPLPHERGPSQRYLNDRDGHPDGSRSPRNSGQLPLRNNGRISPHEDRSRPPVRSPGSGAPLLPAVHEFRRPSVLSGTYEDGFEHPSSIPGLARRRGDAAQAKASRLHIDTGSSGNSSFENHSSFANKSAAVAKSAPPHKLSFGNDGRDAALPHETSRDGRYGPHLNPFGAASSQAIGMGPNDHRGLSGLRHPELMDSISRKDSREDILGSRERQGIPDMPHTANPLARPSAVSQGFGRGGSYVPQTATLPSPAYHTTQFARGGGAAAAGGGVPRTAGLNPPPTARLPEHLRSPPTSKAHFLGLFSDFYESLHDSRVLKATLEDQIKRSNTLLQTLQNSRRVLEETVERRVREERVMWEGRVRGLESRVRELETKTGADENPRPSSVSDPAVATAAGNVKSPDKQTEEPNTMRSSNGANTEASSSDPVTTEDARGDLSPKQNQSQLQQPLSSSGGRVLRSRRDAKPFDHHHRPTADDEETGGGRRSNRAYHDNDHDDEAEEDADLDELRSTHSSL